MVVKAINDGMGHITDWKVGTVEAVSYTHLDVYKRQLRATVRKAKAEAMKAEAGAEAMRIDNAEHATRILMEKMCIRDRYSGMTCLRGISFTSE